MHKLPDLSPNIFRLLDSVVERKPVSKDVLDIVIKLAAFDRGAVFLTGKKNELKLAVTMGSRMIGQLLGAESGDRELQPQIPLNTNLTQPN